MNPSDDQLLNYSGPQTPPRTPRRPSRFWGVTAITLMILQVPWLLPAMLTQRRFLMDGSVKQPLRDFCFYMLLPLPALVAAALSFIALRRHRRSGLSYGSAIAHIIVLMLAALLILNSLYGWIDDDLVHAATPHEWF